MIHEVPGKLLAFVSKWSVSRFSQSIFKTPQHPDTPQPQAWLQGGLCRTWPPSDALVFLVIMKNFLTTLLTCHTELVCLTRRYRGHLSPQKHSLRNGRDSETLHHVKVAGKGEEAGTYKPLSTPFSRPIITASPPQYYFQIGLSFPQNPDIIRQILLCLIFSRTLSTQCVLLKNIRITLNLLKCIHLGWKKHCHGTLSGWVSTLETPNCGLS